MTDDVVPSPCVRRCALDPVTRLCIGCRRTLDEIQAWPGMGAAARRAVLAALSGRTGPGGEPPGDLSPAQSPGP